MRLKTDVKKQIGCSPDKPDCWNYGIYGLQNVEPDPVKAENGQVIYRHRPPKIVNFMAV
jgi:hypothetical protein